MKSAILVLLVLLLSVSSSFGSEWEDVGRENRDISAVLPDPVNARTVYLGCPKGVFKSQDQAKTWRRVLSVRGQNHRVNYLAFGPQPNPALYAATGAGLYRSCDQGQNWERVFKGKNSLENECTCIAALGNSVYLGTKSGLFVSRDGAKSWQKERGLLGDFAVLTIVHQQDAAGLVYVAGVGGVFRLTENSWERIFVAKPNEATEQSDDEEDQDEDEMASEIRYLAGEKDNLYLATTIGIYRSRDQGQTWGALSESGLLRKKVKFLLATVKGVYAANQSGVFIYQNGHWEELSLGLACADIRFLALDKEENLYAACDKGLFRADLKRREENSVANARREDIRGEPDINTVQQAAIEYAEVQPEKILRWRKQAAKRALLPKVTLSMDRDIDRTASSTLWGTYSSNGVAGRYFAGPDDVTRYDNRNFGVSVTWELGDLIWSEDQTSIDVRSRLMVQLRDDVLDEVTKLYFERLRVKMELDNLSFTERKKISEKELRLKELTAYLDGLTGGFFSAQLEKNKT